MANAILNFHFDYLNPSLMGLQEKLKSLILAGLEPAIPCFVVRCLIHWATGPQVTVPPLHYYQPLAIRQNLDYVSKSLRNMAKLPGQFF